MSKMSLLDKLGVLVKLSTTSKSYVIILAILLIFGIVLSFTNKKNAKLNKILYVVMTIVIVTLLIATYHSSLGNMFNYMMNNFFIAVCFPTIAIYFAAIIAMNIIVWVSIFSFKSSKQIRTLNISIYIIMNYLLALLLKVINTHKLDIFDQASLYSNKDATALIELSSLVFVVWVIFLILYKVILIYIKKDYKPTVKRIIVRKKVKKLPENFEPTEVPDYIYSPRKESLVINTHGKSEDEVMLEQFTKQFTLEDYKYFSKLLREEQERIAKKKVDFIDVKDKVKVQKKKKKKEEIKEVVIEAMNDLDDYREKQKQEIIQMEEERRELLKKEQEKLIEIVPDEVFDDKEREQKKLSELEMLYR